MSTTQIHQRAIDQQDTIWNVPDELWKRLQLELTIDKPRKKSGRPRLPDRPIFDGVIHTLRTGGQWKSFSKKLATESTAFEQFCEEYLPGGEAFLDSGNAYHPNLKR